MNGSLSRAGAWIAALSLLALATACGGGGSGGTTTPPTANAGQDQNVVEDTPVALSGTATAGSSAVASVAWTQTSGPAVALSGASTDTPSFTAPKAPIQGTVSLAFLYTVTDANGQTGSDSVSVVVSSDDFVVFIADKDTLSVQELYKSDVESGGVTKLNGPLIAGGQVQSVALSPDGRFAAYTATQDSLTETELYVARTDGSGFVKASGPMVATGSVQGAAFWAPDSSRVAYYANQDTLTVTELYTALPDGTGQAKVNGPLVASGAVTFFGVDPWAPDSSRLAYLADQDTDTVIEAYTSLPDGSGNVKVSGTIAAPNGINFGQSLLWAPDSSRIAYIAAQDDATVQELYAASPGGGSTQKLNGALVAGGNVFQATWAPNSSRIVYLADQDTDNVNELYSSLADGSSNTRLNDPALAAGSSVFSFSIAPDSSRVAYVANPNGPAITELFAAPIAGGGNVTLNGALVLNGSVSTYRWAPDSSRIAYVADQDTDEVFEVYTSLPNGAGSVKISGPLPAMTRTDINPSPAIPGDWAPDSSLVSYVVFSAGAPIPFQIPGFSALPDGGGSVEYTGTMDPTQTGLGNWPVWSPDSSRIMYVAHQDSPTMFELYMSSPDGTLNQKISGPLVAGGGVSTFSFYWSP